MKRIAPASYYFWFVASVQKGVEALFMIVAVKIVTIKNQEKIYLNHVILHWVIVDSSVGYWGLVVLYGADRQFFLN